MSAILIIDQDAKGCDAAAQALLKAGSTVMVAQSFPTAFVLSHEHRPDLVLVNLATSDLEGLEAFCRLAYRFPQVIFHSRDGCWPFFLPVCTESYPVVPTSRLLPLVEALTGYQSLPHAEEVLARS